MLNGPIYHPYVFFFIDRPYNLIMNKRGAICIQSIWSCPSWLTFSRAYRLLRMAPVTNRKGYVSGRNIPLTLASCLIWLLAALIDVRDSYRARKGYARFISGKH